MVAAVMGSSVRVRWVPLRLRSAPTSPVPWTGRWANSSSRGDLTRGFVLLLAPLIYIDHQYDNYIHLQV